MRIRKRIRRTTRQYITVALICIIVIGGAAIITTLTITEQIREEYQYAINEVMEEQSQNQRTVYTIVHDMKSGELIGEEDVNKVTVYASQSQESYMGEEGIGKAILLDLPAGTQIMESMLTENIILSELREVEYDVILINSNVINRDYVDVRIMFPNGEDFIILAKKRLTCFEADYSNCFLWISEEEILRMASATIDAYLYPGAKIYTTKYIEPNLQEPSLITYEPSLSNLLLIQNNPNILETATDEVSKLVRKALENRLVDSMRRDPSTKQWNLEEDYIYEKKPNITQSENAPLEEIETDSSRSSLEMKSTSTLEWKEDKDDVIAPLGAAEDDREEDSSFPSGNYFPELGRQDLGLGNTTQNLDKELTTPKGVEIPDENKPFIITEG